MYSNLKTVATTTLVMLILMASFSPAVAQAALIADAQVEEQKQVVQYTRIRTIEEQFKLVQMTFIQYLEARVSFLEERATSQ